MRILLVGGMGRSGSTLLDRLLGQVDGVCSVGELAHVWDRGLRDNERCGCGEPFLSCPFWAAVGDAAFGGWHTVAAEQALASQRSVSRERYLPLLASPLAVPAFDARLQRYGSALSRLYQGIQEVSGARLIVDSSKYPAHGFVLRRVDALEVRLIHLVRDPRGVAYSWSKRVEKPESTAGASYMDTYSARSTALRWLSCNALFHLLSRLGVPTKLLLYENLVRDVRASIHAVLEHGGVPVREASLRFLSADGARLDPTHCVAGNPMKFRTGDIAIRSDDAWRRKLRPGSQRLIHTLGWPLMSRYGYARSEGAAAEPGARGNGSTRRVADGRDRRPGGGAGTVDVEAWARGALEAGGRRLVSTSVIGNGTQAKVLALVTRDTPGREERFALKIFHPRFRNDAPGAAVAEFEAMLRFRKALTGTGGRVTCPRPIAVSEDGSSYLMTMAQGTPLDRHLMEPHDRRGLAAGIVKGLADYYEHVGGVYADFTPENVLVDGTTGTITFLDPTLPNPLFDRLAATARHAPYSVDLGFWLQAVAGGFLRLSLRNPRLAIRRVLLTRCLLEAAGAAAGGPQQVGDFNAEAARLARFHLSRFGRSEPRVRRCARLVAGEFLVGALIASKATLSRRPPIRTSGGGWTTAARHERR